VVLVDSSIWIAIERGLIRLADLVPADEMVAICPAIAHEVLRGAQSAKQYQLAREVMMATVILDSPTPYQRFEEAANVYRLCRHEGVTSSAIDCLITACAIANRVPLLHQDRDFDDIAEATTLQIFTPSSS
jgi:predicted nucleic acid-binding protein